MVSESDLNTEGESTEEESVVGEPASYSAEQTESSMEAPAAPEQAAPKKPKTGGRRAALRILRENVEGVSKDLASFRKNHEVSAKRLEKQVSQLRSEVASLKSHISKESAAARKKQEGYLSKILAKLNTKPKSASKPKKKVKKGKGKK